VEEGKKNEREEEPNFENDAVSNALREEMSFRHVQGAGGGE
jgi:hypothetical protein